MWAWWLPVQEAQILSLHQLGFLDRKENVIFLGPSGMGKTHLAVSLAIAAAERGKRVYYGTLADLVLSLVEAERQGRLKERLATLRQPSLLIVDEIGYLPVTSNGANLFFQLVNARYERNSTVLTSNKSFKEWGDIFGDSVVASALLDRLLHHCHIVNIQGNSYRLREYPGLDLPQEVSTRRRRGRPRPTFRSRRRACFPATAGSAPRPWARTTDPRARSTPPRSPPGLPPKAPLPPAAGIAPPPSPCAGG